MLYMYVVIGIVVEQQPNLWMLYEVMSVYCNTNENDF